MKFYLIIFLSFFVFFISCRKEKSGITLNQEIAIKANSNEQVDKKFNSKTSKIRLTLSAKKRVKNWQEYQNISEFIPKYYKTTTKEALFNSQRLAELTQQLKDTIRVEKFDEPSFRIRLNVLHNEALRLADMDSIPNITNKEIITESNNIVNAFEAVKSKINTVVNKEVLEKDLEEFDGLFDKKDTLLEIPKSKRKIQKLKRKQNRKPRKFNKRIQPLSKIRINEKN